MSDNASYTMPNLETNPANVALWAQASFFFYMCVSSIFDLDMMELSSDPDYLFTVVTGVIGLALLFQVKNSRTIAILIVPILAIVEDPFFLVFGLLWFAPMIYMPALAFDEFDQRPLFGIWTKRGWGTVLLSLFVLMNMVDTGLPDMATEDQLVEEFESDDDGLDELIADCEGESDCSFPDGLPAEGSESDLVTAWEISSMEKNIAYLGLLMLLSSVIALVGTATGRLNIGSLTPTTAGVVLVGVWWVESFLITMVTHGGINLEELYLLPVSGVMLMTIHGLYPMSPAGPE